ncbi:tetraacyldisaccharide 4'-kinase [Thalassotalea piscium]|uniref:Tetraacyldisaccharide 4'-kinase n=1 Tax=Thalassotalea piscium TaxID=1230533 RepID=A0A7X0NKC2_9GAMM|nr:tetraacyldisaccharide 4'-kinase [Thalassotalea piscium]MBB6545000.1 tetraacyldisaccharide 4'-kinase [Thalassotalea piscium]
MRLIEKVWFHQHAAKWLLVPLLLPFSLLFYLLTSLRVLLYRIGIKQRIKTQLPVVVVGNIGIGGNGKTPLVIYLIEQCTSLGIKVGVISRGYGGKASHYPYLLDDKSTAGEAGDEPYLIYQRCKIPVVVGADRVASAHVLAEQGCQLIIADDGLQHYRLQRDIEVIVIDGKRLFGNGFLLPAGPLREGKSRLNSTSHLIVNGELLATEQLTLPYAIMQLKATTIVNLLSGQRLTIDEFCQQYDKVNAIAGIGDPQRFFNTLMALGLTLEHSKGFIDHQAYNELSFNEFTANAPLLMTEKDAVKCYGFAKEHWWYLPVNASFNSDDSNNRIHNLINEIECLLISN